MLHQEFPLIVVGHQVAMPPLAVGHIMGASLWGYRDGSWCRQGEVSGASLHSIEHTRHIPGGIVPVFSPGHLYPIQHRMMLGPSEILPKAGGWQLCVLSELEWSDHDIRGPTAEDLLA